MIDAKWHPVQQPASIRRGFGAWQAVLDGALQRQALETVAAIARQLRAIPAADLKDASLAGGAAGLAVFHAYSARARHDRSEGARAGELLEQAASVMAETPLTPSLYGGLTGLGWVAEQLRQQFPLLATEEINEEVDEVLLEHLETPRWTADYDLIEGLVGFGVYALERVPRPTAVTCLERVIDHLAATAEHSPGAEGVTWWTDPAWLPPETRAKCPRGYYNLGLAHGVPGVIALLGCAYAAGVALDRVWPLLEGAVRWLLAQQGPDGAGFRHWIEPGESSPRAARLAWCYGDPGVAAALLLAARCVEEPAWERAAMDIALRAAARPPEHAGVKDAGLCHGAAGLGHLFNRLYQATGELRLAEAPRFWFRQTLEMRQPDHGIAGYAAFMPEHEGEERWVNDPGLLTGAAGIALALLAAATPVEPNWDRMLLVSIPPRQPALSAR
jgi:hypothetical protein